jgi:SsrA-binding protein
VSGRAEAGEKTVATNRKARHDYLIEERFEAGLVLTGSEVKSLRGGRASLTESYARVQDGEAWIENLHIPPYEQGEKRGYDPKRRRKLLLRRAEIERLIGKTAEKGLTLVPTRLYFKGPNAKLEIALARGKDFVDKRRALRERDQRREIERALREHGR